MTASKNSGYTGVGLVSSPRISVIAESLRQHRCYFAARSASVAGCLRSYVWIRESGCNDASSFGFYPYGNLPSVLEYVSC